MNVLVVGPQCSGSKAVARMLVESGGRRLSEQVYLRTPEGNQRGPLVMHCSFPQGAQWLSVDQLVRRSQADRAVACVRSFHPHLHSMVETKEYVDRLGVRPWGTTGHHPDLDTAEQVMRRAYGEMFAQLYRCGVPYRVVTYRELTEEPQARALLAEWCGLDSASTAGFQFTEGNSKWYA